VTRAIVLQRSRAVISGNSLFHGVAIPEKVAPFLQLHFGNNQAETTGVATSVKKTYTWNAVRGRGRGRGRGRRGGWVGLSTAAHGAPPPRPCRLSPRSACKAEVAAVCAASHHLAL
jgi:hypothetical protein